ncbi:U6 snRNA-associated Sm-like protein LSm7 [Nematocida homosporus]|uniref:U6 snRNA-associated Sm-like protein LSm7 n=1 Tax=Nematocida homosporus TaxID=1912981 RepID=UPI00221FB45F|nr:U6 snRNA-associated Sm-like protein LSm7 [Nematocida homosporus]KAI5187462.1 U6 snRNA-associated Sm-like protein LSm7 [Nematocida homosporus]
MKEDRANKRVQVFDLEKYLGKMLQISFFGGIQICGRLTGYDQILNMVLEEAKMTKIAETDCAEVSSLCQEKEATIMCKGSSICSIDLLEG